MGNGLLHKPRPVSTLGALVVTAGLLGGCAAMPSGQRTSLAEAQAAYQRQDFWTAAQMLKPLAYEGDAEAQYALGYMYYYGHGVKRNRGFAMSWFGEAVRLGHEKAREALAAVRSEARLTRPPGGARPESDLLRAEPVNAAAAPAAALATAGPLADICGGGTARGPSVAEASTRPAGRRPQVNGDNGMPDAREPAAGGVQSALGESGSVDRGPVAAEDVSPAGGAVPAPAAGPEPVVHGTRVAAGGTVTREVPPTTAPASELNTAEPAAPVPIQSAASASKERGGEAAALARQPRFTLQLIGSRSREDLERLVEQHRLQDVRYIEDERKGAPWYRLLYRGFDSLAEARRALQALAPALGRHRPFVRNFPAVQMAALKRRD